MPDLVRGSALALEAHSYKSRVGGELMVEVLLDTAFDWLGAGGGGGEKRLMLSLHVPVFKVKRGVFVLLQI